MNAVIKQYLDAGLSVIPVRPDKRPLVDWKPYQATKATEAQAEAWSLPIAVICGAASGGVTCIDFDDKGSAFKGWCERVRQIDAMIFNDVFVQRTPSGGWHVVFRSGFKIENRKLAQKKDESGKIKVLIETRGEGGYFLVAPSEGYVSKRGNIAALPTISDKAAENLVLIAESFNEVAEDQKPTQVHPERAGVRPLDDYDAKHTPVELLYTHGWTTIGKQTERILFCRPGKANGISATWNYVPNRFYVFSTSTEFTAGQVYKASAVYAMLEHRGDFVAAAKELYKKGYGSRIENKSVDFDTTPQTITVKASRFKDDILKFYKGEREKGYWLGLSKFDKLLRFERGYLNVITGIPTHGKSEFLDYIAMLLATKHQWHFVVFSPENYPLEIHFNKLAEKFQQKSMWSASEVELAESIDFIDEHFDFVNATEEDLSLEAILGACLDVKQRSKVDALIIDPWNEIEHAARPKEMSETEFTGVCLRKLRKFARKNNICLFVVVHPTKMYREKDSNKYPVPNLYDISGSANWHNKADNGIVVYRNFETANKAVDVYVKKVKFRNYGELGAVSFDYDKSFGGYREVSDNDQTQRDFA